MPNCKLTKSFTFPTPIRYEWTKAYTARPKDNLIAHQDILLKHPFRPSYDMDGDPTMDCLLDWSYARVWHTEAETFRTNRKNTVRGKSTKKKLSNCPDRRPKPVEPCRERFTINRFRDVPAKVDTGRSVQPTRLLCTC
ncbi:uncharacterized protein LOC128726943 [Anopheles nili]|uniref:uncharacterized protein LOC128726943 n=1 Tax=Anopheles nili TaxID=185578 RepID=UPI00237AE003|nr:uncharacterized protein LOC128726943 [Anopheles nili]